MALNCNHLDNKTENCLKYWNLFITFALTKRGEKQPSVNDLKQILFFKQPSKFVILNEVKKLYSRTMGERDVSTTLDMTFLEFTLIQDEEAT